MNDLRSQRRESFQVGITAAWSFGCTYGVLLMIRFLIVGASAGVLLKAVVAGLSGFLFGVTYRYTVRSEPTNPFLKDGVVLAFAMVRGLAPVETADTSFNLLWLVVFVGESFLCFAIARLTLERVFKF